MNSAALLVIGLFGQYVVDGNGVATEPVTYDPTPEACDCFDIQLTDKTETDQAVCYSYIISKDKTNDDCKPLKLRSFVMKKDCEVDDDDIIAFTPYDMTVIAEPKRTPINGIRININGKEGDKGSDDIEYTICFKPELVNEEQTTSKIGYVMRGTDTPKSATCNVGAIFPSFCKILAAESACMDSEAYSEDWTFNAPQDGIINGVELAYKSGSVSCNEGDSDTDGNPAESYWGCYRNLMLVNFLKMGSPDNVMLYPTLTMEGFDDDGEFGETESCDLGCDVHKWTMDDTTPYDDVLRMQDYSNLYAVITDDTFSVQYSESCCDLYLSDNAGTVCFDVYFIYDAFDDDYDTSE